MEDYWEVTRQMDQFRMQWSRLDHRWKLYWFLPDGSVRVVNRWE